MSHTADVTHGSTSDRFGHTEEPKQTNRLTPCAPENPHKWLDFVNYGSQRPEVKTYVTLAVTWSVVDATDETMFPRVLKLKSQAPLRPLSLPRRAGREERPHQKPTLRAS